MRPFPLHYFHIIGDIGLNVQTMLRGILHDCWNLLTLRNWVKLSARGFWQLMHTCPASKASPHRSTTTWWVFLQLDKISFIQPKHFLSRRRDVLWPYPRPSKAIFRKLKDLIEPFARALLERLDFGVSKSSTWSKGGRPTDKVGLSPGQKWLVLEHTTVRRWEQPGSCFMLFPLLQTEDQAVQPLTQTRNMTFSGLHLICSAYFFTSCY